VTLWELDDAISTLENIDEYKLVQMDAVSYQLHLVSQREDKLQLSDQASELLKKLYGEKARVEIIFGESILPENSGKYLVSKALFPIKLDGFLDSGHIFGKHSVRSVRR
jgi:hypothetical protein